MTLTIKRLGRNDVTAMRQLNALFSTVFEDPDSYASKPPEDIYLEALLAKDHFLAVVAMDGAEVVGGLAAYQLDKFEQARSEIYIYDLAVAVSHRRRGIARTLITELTRIAAERGCWVVYVQADYGDDPAIALYTSMGTREDVLHFDIAVPPKPGS
ncbi:MAG TPA: AAC(3)-I family aminoglycoside N-acetyltransferase [Devosia sp.]|jgi:aminoglycoside 3-N-acetyltransferase I|uniref:AAC(3)-I family aminoglycoside N-acetyltransferase n=1 Tax=Devosia sp. TaxID=1871048 RepID=UPI002F955277